jgi:hypothetical protein
VGFDSGAAYKCTPAENGKPFTVEGRAIDAAKASKAKPKPITAQGSVSQTDAAWPSGAAQ